MGSITINKSSGVDGILAEVFQILKDDAFNCYIKYASKFGKLSSGHRTGKVQFSSIPKKGNSKECSKYYTIAFISHSSKVILKIIQYYMNHELPDVKAGFRKGRGTRIKLPTSVGS